MFGWRIRFHAFVTLHTIQLVKGTPFQEEPPRIGHYREYPRGGGPKPYFFVVILKKCLLKNSNASDVDL